jgi:hypothetical protein
MRELSSIPHLFPAREEHHAFRFRFMYVRHFRYRFFRFLLNLIVKNVRKLQEMVYQGQLKKYQITKTELCPNKT